MTIRYPTTTTNRYTLLLLTTNDDVIIFISLRTRRHTHVADIIRIKYILSTGIRQLNTRALTEFYINHRRNIIFNLRFNEFP